MTFRRLINWFNPNRLVNIQLKLNLPKDTSITALAAIIGTINGFVLVLYHHSINFINTLLFETVPLFFSEALIPYYKGLIPAFGGILIAIIFTRVKRYEKEYGAPAIMDAVVNNGGLMPKSLPVVTFVASIICIATGGSVGVEGPSILIGAGIASLIGKQLKFSDDRVRLLVGAGAATGLAATFNVPIAGAIFALEIIMADFSIRAFSPVVIASVFATTVSRMYIHEEPIFFITNYSLKSPFELPLYLILGILGGFVSVFFIKAHKWFHFFFKNLKKVTEFWKPVIGGLLIGVMGVAYNEIYGFDDSVIERILLGNYEIEAILFLFLLKLLATNITLASGGVGGLFTPSLILGASYGLFFGKVVNLIFPEITAPAGAYAMVGMAVLTAGVQHAMLSAILIIFECTADYEIMLPLMIGVVPAIMVSRYLHNDSIYTMQFKFWGDRIARGRNIEILEKMKLEPVINEHYDVIEENVPLLGIINKFMNTRYSNFPVVTVKGDLVGIISLRDIREIMFDESIHPLLIAHDFATHDIVYLSDEMNIEDAFRKFDYGDFDSLPIVKGNTMQLRGMVSKEDIIQIYRKELLFGLQN
jgi:chloride channel protein, CIC family